MLAGASSPENHSLAQGVHDAFRNRDAWATKDQGNIRTHRIQTMSRKVGGHYLGRWWSLMIA